VPRSRIDGGGQVGLRLGPGGWPTAPGGCTRTQVGRLCARHCVPGGGTRTEVGRLCSRHCVPGAPGDHWPNPRGFQNQELMETGDIALGWQQCLAWQEVQEPSRTLSHVLNAEGNLGGEAKAEMAGSLALG
jgi:hypothetical protein